MSACTYTPNAKNGLKLHIVNDNVKVPSQQPSAIELPTNSSCAPTTALTATLQPDDVSEGSSASTSSSSLFLRKIKTPLNIGFHDLKFTVRQGVFKKKDKVILNGMDGEFRAGDLTAIMGSSGTGKSTLLDILSGYTSHNVRGEITVNGAIRNEKKFRRQSAYIMQDHEIQPLLTVLEAMYFSASLKIGDEQSRAERKAFIKQILIALGLYESRKTRSGQLSGGQKKRLAIGLEIVNNPPVMFFDEPTSGLDSSTAIQVISILRKMTREGRTIVCTIHQPSFKTFHMFDKLYAVSKGRCIYQGPIKELVPFLDSVGMPCPSYHNPSDFLMDLASGEYNADFDTLTNAAMNKYYADTYKDEVAKQRVNDLQSHNERLTDGGVQQNGESVQQEACQKDTIIKMSCDNNFKDNNTKYKPCDRLKLSSAKSEPTLDTSAASKLHSTLLSLSHTTLEKFMWKASTTPRPATSITDPQLLAAAYSKVKKPTLPKLGRATFCKRDDRYATTFCRQFYLLLMRTFIILRRDKSMTRMRFFVHCLVGGLIGILYLGIGNNAAHAFNNFNYAFFSIMFLMFTAFSSMQMQFPVELPIITREHFNRWYSLRAYYLAMTLADVPLQICCTFAYILITYFMTAQPLEFFRFGLFIGICLMVTFVAQGLGLVVGSLFDIKNGAVWGSFFICPFLIFSGFFIHLSDAHPMMHWLFHISFLKYALEGATLALFGYDRERMECFDDYCHFVLPKKLMKTIDMQDGDYLQAVLFLFSMFLLFRVLAFYIMNFRLRFRR